jgi:mono/diheme cytochrome c family protein/plastocyanin
MRATLHVLLGLGAVIALGASRAATPAGPQPRTVVLTALMAQGIWTDEPVTAANAWRRDFRPASLVLRTGETVRLRLESPDVVHSFALPDLGIDAVAVRPGQPSWVTVTAPGPGTFPYYCTIVCGERHFAMRGLLVVTDDGLPPRRLPDRQVPEYWREPAPRAGAGSLERGRALFQKSGCVACHGEGGRGGVRNPNSMNATVPELETLARRTFLFTPEDVARFRAILDGPPSWEGSPPAATLPLAATVTRQYLATRQIVRDGRRSTRLDANGPQPALDMPAWETRLDVPSVDAILSYLLTLDGAGARPTPVATVPAREGDMR